VSEPEFTFSLEIDGERRFDDMVNELAAAVLAWIGCGDELAGAVTGDVRKALAAAHGHRRCQVRFVARDGRLRLEVASAGQPTWHTDLALPTR